MHLAHVKWFVDDPQRVPLDWSLLVGPFTLLGLGLVAAGILVLPLLQRVLNEERLTRWLRRNLRPVLPLLLSVHLAVALTAYALTRRYLAPGLDLPGTGWGTVLAGAQLLVAMLIALGLFTRLAAGLLVLSGPVGALFYGVLPILERMELLGIALYLALVGRRRFAVDALIRRRPDPGRAMNPVAVGMLRLFAGLAVAVNALTEKLLAPEVSAAFLQDQSSFNLLRGAGVSDAAFAGIAGAVELALGLLLATGVGTRLLVLIAVIPFNATLLFLGWEELIGHLPIYGIFLVLLIEGGGRIRDPGSWRRAERALGAGLDPVSSGTAGSSSSTGSRS
ncbi:MAG: hypothetical protein M3245_03020 [Actinomycetota bacterium]|nr:hypothetical protein [Actinomycetota bacterium]